MGFWTLSLGEELTAFAGPPAITARMPVLLRGSTR